MTEKASFKLYFVLIAALLCLAALVVFMLTRPEPLTPIETKTVAS